MLAIHAVQRNLKHQHDLGRVLWHGLIASVPVERHVTAAMLVSKHVVAACLQNHSCSSGLP